MNKSVGFSGVVVRRDERGMALLAVLMVVFLLTLLGMTSMQLAGQEMVGASALQEERTAHHAAEAAVDVVMGWFHDPARMPQGLEPAWLAKRVVNAQGDPSYFDLQGRSQFVGTVSRPDMVFDAANPQHDVLLNDPQTGMFKSLKGLARILKLRVYGAARPGLLCTVEVTAGAGHGSRVTKTLSVEFGAYAIPALHAPLQSGTIGSESAQARPGAVLVHWGDMMVRGQAYFPRPDELPTKSGLASVTGQAYGEMTHPEDRWLDVQLGGEAFFAQLPAAAWSGIPLNVHAHQEPVPGIKVDLWDYDALKRMSKQFGRYYGMDREGLLYPGGLIQAGLGRPAAEVFASTGPGDHRGLIFVDTLDGMPPRLDNLGTIVLDQEYVEGIFVVNAHVLWKAGQPGKPVLALSPPPEGQQSLGTRVPVQLSGIHLQGVLYVAGDVRYAGHLKVYGGVLAQGSMVDGTNGSGVLEVWYNHDLREGLIRGLPLVFVAPGSWQVKI
ncbi:MAG: PilX N-terminal domain-containing pilus assembly protein [Nitrospira sp.]